MTRTRLSTTVDRQLLESARDLRPGSSDAALIDEALNALLRRHRSAEVDASYAAYDEHPLDEPDEWGDLASLLVDRLGRLADSRMREVCAALSVAVDCIA
jgi:hypothetical protein